jgi:hypothetical protein
MRKRGSLNVGRRLECGFALVTATIKGGKAVVSDFTPHEEQPIASDSDVIALVMGGPRG